MDPIRDRDDATEQTLCYDTVTREIYRNTNAAKTFVIHHPKDDDKYLVHACLEGPESGVYYRGVNTLVDGKAVVELPDYVESIAESLTVHVTPLVEFEELETLEAAVILLATRVKNGKFGVAGNVSTCDFSWLVFGKRENVNVCPKKSDVILHGLGPYTWYSDV